MKLIKKLWTKLGEEKFSMQVMTGGCVLLTIYNVIFMSNLPEFNALMMFINAVMIFATIMGDDDNGK